MFRTPTADMHPIPSAQKENILSLASHGHSTCYIASHTGISQSTVSRVLKTILPNQQSPHAGHHSKLSVTATHSILRQITCGKAANAVQATRNINTVIPHPVSTQTVRNVLRRHSFKAVTKKKKPLLSTVHRKKRLDFALRYKEWTVEDWKRVIWSDETKINRIGSDGKQWVWKQVGEGLIEREVQGTLKFGGGNIMVWGCMGWNGVGQLVEVEGRMDADQYVDILDNHLVPSLEESGIPVERCIFQQDNDPKHTSRKAKNWVEENNITLLDWPPQSPDLNPIEHLWQHIKSQLANYETPAKGVWEIWERVAEVWNNIEPEVCQNLIESMPRRVEAVIKAKGGHTKY
jgi:DDE superfamily endonuclease/Transposase